jgi:protein-tyrosine phosphatase
MRELDEGSLDEVPDTEDPIYNVVDCLRKQRMMMVQGEQQYWFLYDVMREKWRERWARAHPEEAERLGIGAVRADEHKAKKAKSGDGDEGELSDAPMDEQLAGDEDEHAEVEAELADAETAFEQGKT